MRLPDFTDYLIPPGPEIPRKGYFAMDEAEYHAYPAVSAGLLKGETQAHMLTNRMAGPASGDEKVDLVLGTLVHAATLEPWKFSEENWHKYYAIAPGKTLDSKEAAAARAENPGKLLVTVELLDLAARIRREAIETNPTVLSLLSSPSGMKEATGIVWDPKFQCRRKWRCDYLPMRDSQYGNYILDLKTTRVELDRFSKEAWSKGYYLSAAWYLDCHYLLTGHWMEYYRWIGITKQANGTLYSHPFQMRNLRPTDELYKDPTCKLRQAREILGLDDSAGRVGKLNQFLDAARQTVAFASPELDMDMGEVRTVWPAMEQLEITEIF